MKEPKKINRIPYQNGHLSSIKYQVEILIDDQAKKVEFANGYCYELNDEGQRIANHQINYEKLKQYESIFISGHKYACIRE